MASDHTTAASGAASQPEALRLAHELESRAALAVKPSVDTLSLNAAAELRRLHALTTAAPAAQEAEPAIDSAFSVAQAALLQCPDRASVRAIMQTLRARVAAPRPQADAGAVPAVPEGWRLLPAKATQEILDAIRRVVDLETSDPEDHRYDDGTSTADALYEALLAAAPQAPAAPTADEWLNAAVEKAWDRFQQAVKPANGEPPAVPYAQHERELAAELEQREQAESVIDLLCDAVLGPDRAEWSSAYGYQAAINEVSERIAELERKAAPAPAAGAAPTERRNDLVPGVMHCAKCKFQLNRVTLCVSDGNTYAGDSKTEPCPNGCGPLWPVTWEQEARSGWKALEEMHDRLQNATRAAAPAPDAPRLIGVDMAAGPDATAYWTAEPAPLTQAVRDVLAERQRQISEIGYAPDHDDEHADGSLARAAACYALGRKSVRALEWSPDVILWPWENWAWKNGEPRRMLVKAGALILAEIERLDRAAARARQEGGAA